MEMYNDDYGAEAATKSSEISKKKVGGAAAAAAGSQVPACSQSPQGFLNASLQAESMPPA